MEYNDLKGLRHSEQLVVEHKRHSRRVWLRRIATAFAVCHLIFAMVNFMT